MKNIKPISIYLKHLNQNLRIGDNNSICHTLAFIVLQQYFSIAILILRQNQKNYKKYLQNKKSELYSVIL